MRSLDIVRERGGHRGPVAVPPVFTMAGSTPIPSGADGTAQRGTNGDSGRDSEARFAVSAPQSSGGRNLRKATRLGVVAWLVTQPLIGTAAAQTQVGKALCGTPIATFINGSVPLVVSLAMIVGAVFAAFMHARAGVAADAEQARFYMDWRNRAGYTAVTAPLLAFLIQMLIGMTGTGIAECINLVPFF